MFFKKSLKRGQKMLTKMAQAISRELSTRDYRMRVISPVTNNRDVLSNPRELNRQVRAIAADCGISDKTVHRWIDAYLKEGSNGLIPRYPRFRSNKKLYVSFDALLEEAKLMRVKTPTISVNEIIRCLESEHPEIVEIGVLKRSTLQAHLMKSGFSRGALLREREKDGRAFYGRYRKEHRLEQVQGDIKEPPKHSCVDDETGLPVVPYLQLWMDNATRKILTYRIGVNQTEDIALSSLRELIETYGIPDTILTDQGSIYRGSSFCHCTHALGITHRRSKPYQPQSKGCLERANGTIDDLFIPIKDMTGVSFSMFKKLVEQRIIEYNNTKHSALVFLDENKQKYLLSPNEAFERDTATSRMADPQMLEYAFKLNQSRKVSKDGLVSFRGKNYKIPGGLARAGDLVPIIYSLTDHTVEMAVRNSEDEIRNGSDEFLFYELHELEIKADVQKEDYKRVISEELKELIKKAASDPIPPSVVRLMRNAARREGTYENEDQFKKDILPKVYWNAPEVPDADQSAYGTAPAPSGKTAGEQAETAAAGTAASADSLYGNGGTC